MNERHIDIRRSNLDLMSAFVFHYMLRILLVGYDTYVAQCLRTMFP